MDWPDAPPVVAESDVPADVGLGVEETNLGAAVDFVDEAAGGGCEFVADGSAAAAPLTFGCSFLMWAWNKKGQNIIYMKCKKITGAHKGNRLLNRVPW